MGGAFFAAFFPFAGFAAAAAPFSSRRRSTSFFARPDLRNAFKSRSRSCGSVIGDASARFFNTSGESYRNGSFKERLPALSQAEALSALAQDGKLIKRPLLVDGERVLVGFDEKKWSEALL